MQVLVRHERVNLLVMQVLGLLDNLFIKMLIEMWNDAEGASELDLARISLHDSQTLEATRKKIRIRVQRDRVHINKIRQKIRQ